MDEIAAVTNPDAAYQVFEAVKIMVVGMVTVFSFLVFMIFFLKAQGAFLTRFFPQKPLPLVPIPTNDASSLDIKDPTLHQVILAAIGEHTKRKKG
ncbi:hypothetical protein AGMMS50229_03890 [Campylobacterota bacterium]|nr:hypothetical protein AGMMS50229_03890 [Campylobacterota bacterium]